jgi:hypothetical protein
VGSVRVIKALGWFVAGATGIVLLVLYNFGPETVKDDIDVLQVGMLCMILAELWGKED